MTEKDVGQLRDVGLAVCYSYETLDLENREFTEGGYTAICNDMLRAIAWGFTHVQLSNPYIIELVTNEFSRDLKVVLSSQLEFTSGRAVAFLDVLNNSVPVTHIVVSQSQLTESGFCEMRDVFLGRQLVVEVDRWVSDVHAVHERYYNVLYGYDSSYARAELRRLTSDPIALRANCSTRSFLLGAAELLYKVGEVNVDPSLLLANVQALEREEYSCLRNVDVEMWQ